MTKRIVLIPTPCVRPQNSGRLLDVFIFLLLWYAIRFAVDAAVHRVALALLPPELLPLRFQLAYSARSLIGLIFGISSCGQTRSLLIWPVVPCATPW